MKPLSNTLDQFKAAAEQGNADAQYGLAFHYATTDDAERDLVAAANWYGRAAKQGHKNAQYLFARCHADGRGMRKNSAQAVKWLHLAAENGHPHAALDLGKLHLEGCGVQKDSVRAAFYFDQAAKQGVSEAKVSFNGLTSKFSQRQCHELCKQRREATMRETAKAISKHLELSGRRAWQNHVAELTKIAVSQEEALDKFYHNLLGQKPESERLSYEPAEELFRDLPFRSVIKGFKLGNYHAAIASAVQGNDLAFFERVGKELMKKPREVNEYDRLQYLLAKHWVEMPNRLPPLCFFTDEALTEFAQIERGVGTGGFNMEMVRKVRQRLGLVHASKRLVREVEFKSGKLVINQGPRSMEKQTRRSSVGKEGLGNAEEYGFHGSDLSPDS